MKPLDLRVEQIRERLIALVHERQRGTVLEARRARRNFERHAAEDMAYLLGVYDALKGGEKRLRVVRGGIAVEKESQQ